MSLTESTSPPALPAHRKLRKKRPVPDFLAPLRFDSARKKFACVDIESKFNDTDAPGFTRPFLVGILDPNEGIEGEYVEYADEPHLKSRHWQSRHWLPGGCVDKAMNYMLQDRFLGYTFYAHNGGAFDHLFWLRWLRVHQDEFGFSVIPVQSSIQVITVWRKPENPDEKVTDVWTFLDSVKLLPMSLERAAKTFGVPGKLDHDLSMPEGDLRWSAYLQQDCRVLASVLQKFHDMIELTLGGEVGMTAPSTSMKLFRKKFLGKGTSPKKIPRYQHWDDCPRMLADGSTCRGCAHDWIRRGYYGGRTERFEGWAENVNYYDLNSSYVASMKEKMPVDDRRVVFGEIDWRLHRTHTGFAEVEVYIPPDCVVPPLPHISKDSGKLLFPTGYIKGVWSLEELALLSHERVNGKITHVGRVVWFRKKPVFAEMVDELWALRDKSNPAWDRGLSELAKLMGNALYGKFGMDPERTAIAFADCLRPDACFLCQAPIEMDAGICLGCEGSKSATGEIDSDVWYQRKRVDAAYIIPHFSAHITALARVRLWHVLDSCIKVPGGRVYYTDTDSCITNVKLATSPRLGELKDEYPGMQLTFTATGPKSYMLEAPSPGFPEEEKSQSEWKTAKVTLKGFPPDLRTKENFLALIAGSKLSKEERARCDDGEDGEDNHLWVDIPSKAGKASRCEHCGTLQFTRLEKIRSLARIGFSRSPQMVNVKKSFKSADTKRVHLGDGTSRAIALDEREESSFADDSAAE